MKSTLVKCLFAVSVAFAFFASCNACNKLCVDRNPKLCLATQFCGNLFFKLMCPLSCKLCMPCPVPCVFGPCADTISTCALLRLKDPLLCHNFRNECKATCGACCKLPPPPTPCTLSCADKDPINCPGWKTYCKSKNFPDTKYVCPLSCGSCKPCSLPPPTSPTFVSGATDTNATLTASVEIDSTPGVSHVRG